MKGLFRAEAPGTQYGERTEMTSAGLHAAAYELIRAKLPVGARILDLGSGQGAWPQRLLDAGCEVIACDRVPREGAIPIRAVDLNADFALEFPAESFDAVTLIEVIEHLENPRHVLRQARRLLKPNGVLLLTTPNASGVYSRLRFFFTGEMSMFTDADYEGSGHISPITAWVADKMLSEIGFGVCIRRFYDRSFIPPQSLGDIAKVVSWLLFRPFMRGTVGGQVMMILASPSIKAVSSDILPSPDRTCKISDKK